MPGKDGFSAKPDGRCVPAVYRSPNSFPRKGLGEWSSVWSSFSMAWAILPDLLKAPQQAFNPIAVFKGRVVKKFHLRHIP
jgi:hypothetical protein